MKYIIDTDKLPCNNGQNCTSCPFWGFEEGSCSINEQVKRLPVYEERPHGKWVSYSTSLPKLDGGKWVKTDTKDIVWRCSVCDEVSCCKADFCPNCGSKMLDKRQEGE